MEHTPHAAAGQWALSSLNRDSCFVVLNTDERTDQDPRNSFGFLRLCERAHTPTIAAATPTNAILPILQLLFPDLKHVISWISYAVI